MRLTNEIKDRKLLLYIIISGNGTKDFPVFKELCKRFNGHNKYLCYPKPPFKKETGLKALNLVKYYPTSKLRIDSIIYVVDKEHIRGDFKDAIQEALIGVNIIEVQEILEALLIKLKLGSHNVILYCIPMGDQTLLEEEIAKLIELELNVTIDLSGNRNSNWNSRVKSDIKRALRNNHTNIKKFLKNAQKRNLKVAFPNICSILKKIEEEID